MLYSDPTLRPSSAVLKRNERGPSTLWAHGISGDLPIVLVRIDEAEDLEIVRQLLRAHEYWRMKRLAVDLVILNERPSSYAAGSPGVAGGAGAGEPVARRSPTDEGARGSVFVLRADLVSLEVRSAAAEPRRARCCSAAAAASPSRSSAWRSPSRPPPRRRAACRPAPRQGSAQGDVGSEPPEAAAPRPEIEFFNGLGGFAADGREYVTILGEGQWTPAPWINVIANPSFGFQVSVEGGGYTWSINSRENQLTPWSNDPVGDRPGEVIYVRDEDSGALWGPTALPIREEAGALRRPTRPGLQPLRAHLARHRARAAAVRAARRPDQDLAPDDPEQLGPHPAPLGHRVRGVGARHRRAAPRRRSS